MKPADLRDVGRWLFRGALPPVAVAERWAILREHFIRFFVVSRTLALVIPTAYLVVLSVREQVFEPIPVIPVGLLLLHSIWLLTRRVPDVFPALLIDLLALGWASVSGAMGPISGVLIGYYVFVTLVVLDGWRVIALLTIAGTAVSVGVVARIVSDDGVAWIVGWVFTSIGVAIIITAVARVVGGLRLSRESVVGELEVERAKAQERIDTLAVVSHELKNPIAGVHGAMDLLAETDDPEAQRELLELAHQQARQLWRLVDDMSVASRLERGMLQIEPAPVDLRFLARTLEVTHGAEVGINLPEGQVLGDFDRVLQVLNNLLTNAKRYGRLPIEVSAEQDGDTWRIVVEDDGDGVPVADRERIFQPYVQTRARGIGLGIGLPLSRGLARLMDGDLVLEHRVGGGARFVLTLPAV